MFIQGVLCFIAVFACLCFCCFLSFLLTSLTFGKSALWANIRKFFPEAKSQSGSPSRQKMPFELKRKQSSCPSHYMLARMFTESMPGCFYKTSVLSNGHLSSNWKILRNLDKGTCCASFRAVLRYLWRFPNERWT